MSAPRWIDRAHDALATSGRKRGAARSALLALLDAQACALTVPEIETALGAGSPRPVSRASIYRILDELERLGLVQRVEVGASMARYERSGEEAAHHHHLVCERCGRLTPFYDRELERAIERLSDEVPLHVTEHEIVLRGACPTCAP